jgi:hypothetical protein
MEGLSDSPPLDGLLWCATIHVNGKGIKIKEAVNGGLVG